MQSLRKNRELSAGRISIWRRRWTYTVWKRTLSFKGYIQQDKSTYTTTYINIDVKKTSICTRLLRQLADSWPPMPRHRVTFPTNAEPVGFLCLSRAYQNRYWKPFPSTNLSGEILVHSASWTVLQQSVEFSLGANNTYLPCEESC